MVLLTAWALMSFPRPLFGSKAPGTPTFSALSSACSLANLEPRGDSKMAFTAWMTSAWVMASWLPRQGPAGCGVGVRKEEKKGQLNGRTKIQKKI